MSAGAIERAFRDAVLGHEADAEIGDLRAFLEARGVPEDDIAAMLEAPPRLDVYRRLVRNTLEGVAYRLLERTRARMGDAFDESFSRFLHERGPQTRYLRDVPAEFVAWAAPRWHEAGIAPWLVELGRHELVCFLVSTAPKLAEPRAGDVAIDKPLLLSSLARIERFAHAVHELPPEPEKGEHGDEPVARDVTLLYYRDEDFELRTLELTAFAATLLERAPATPLRDAIAAACEATGEALNDTTLVAVARLLADLGERGVLIGAPAE